MPLWPRLLHRPRRDAIPRAHTFKTVAGSAGAASGDLDAQVSASAKIAADIEAGRLPDALGAVDELLLIRPDDGELLLARGATLFAGGRYSEARNLFLRAMQVGFESSDLFKKLGWTCLWLQQIDDAAQAMRRATELTPHDWAAHFGLATVLRAQKCASESKDEFERALVLNPESAHSRSGLILCEIELGHFTNAEALARRGVEENPNAPGAFADLGMALCSLERHDEAVAAFERALAFETDGEMDEDAVNFAICLLRAGRPQRVLDLMEKRLFRYPSVGLHSHYALALLSTGRVAEGCRQFEFRWIEEPYLSGRPNFVKPQWSGQDLSGKKILLWSEQGFGDSIQFIRYARHVKTLGATVVVFARTELHELFERLPSIDKVLGPNEPYPPFDYYINLLSLPRVLGTDLASIPGEVPYLSIDRDRTATWAARLRSDGELKIGIVWAGSPTHLGDRYRSFPVESLDGLIHTLGTRFYSLQKGAAADALKSTSFSDLIVDLGPELTSFADTAAAISALDLVIGVDTAVVHLAGALGKPVWTLLPRAADWRWMEEREDSPWYPTMRLFRQRTHCDWDDVLARTRAALEGIVSGRQLKAGNEDKAQTRAASYVANTQPPQSFSRVAETRVGIAQYFPDDSEVGRAVEFYGEYRQLQLESLDRLIAPGMTIVEIDAGIGVHALWLAKRIGQGAHLFLYEEDGRKRQVLQQNLRSNRITNATVMRGHLSGSASMTNADGTEQFAVDRYGERSPAPERSETIDELRLEYLHCIKINRCDSALDVLEGAGETLWRLRPRLFMSALHNDELTFAARRAADFGYASWRFQTRLFNPQNFNDRDEDIFAGQMVVTLVALPEEFIGDPMPQHYHRIE